MQNWLANLESVFPMLFGGAVVWIFLGIGASILYRKSKGKPIFPRKPDHTTYFDSSGSGNSNRNFITKLGGAQNCLLIAVTDDLLIVQPKFPFNLMFLPEVYGLEYNIPRKKIDSIVEKKGFLGRAVTVEFSALDGKRQSLDLRLRKMDEFLAALGAK